MIEELLFSTLPAAIAVSFIAEFISVGKWRTLIALIVSGTMGYLLGITQWEFLVPLTLSATFIALLIVSAVGSSSIDTTARVGRNLPRRIPPL